MEGQLLATILPSIDGVMWQMTYGRCFVMVIRRLHSPPNQRPRRDCRQRTRDRSALAAVLRVRESAATLGPPARVPSPRAAAWAGQVPHQCETPMASPGTPPFAVAGVPPGWITY